MATYFVEINAKYLVKLELDGSCAAAEHYFLDKYTFVWAAHAYDEKGMKTECFRGALLNSEIVSLSELDRILREIEQAKEQEDQLGAKVDEADKEVEELERKLKEAKEKRNTLRTAWDEAGQQKEHLIIASNARRPW